MSTRRTTRATSRAASSRGGSPSATEVPPTPTSRRARRSTPNAGLPRVGLQTSTSYGTNSTRAPATLRQPGPDQSTQINDVVQNLLNPIQEDDRSFQHADSLFGDGIGIDSSSLLGSEEPAGIPNYPQRRPVVESDAMQTRRPLVKEVAQKTKVNPSVLRSHNAAMQSLSRATDRVSSSKLFTWVKDNILLIILAFLALIILQALFQKGGYHRLGQFVPEFSYGSTSHYSGVQLSELQKRMNIVEQDISHLKRRTDLDRSAIAHLEGLLPSFLVCKKDENGNVQIPHDFWHALQEKIRNDNSLLEYELPTGSASTSSLSKKDIRKIAESEAEHVFEKSNKVWEKYLNENNAKITQWLNDDNEKLTSKLVSQGEFIQELQKNWDVIQDHLKIHVEPLTKRFEEALRHIANLEQKTTSLVTKHDARSIANEVAKKLISGIQLEGLAKTNINKNAADDIKRVNHFSLGTGAVVNPQLTSKNYCPPEMNRNILVRGLHRMFWRPIPRANPPEYALTKWEEHGDCWCSLSKSESGYGPTLAILTAHNIIPDHVVVEHVPTAASLEPGAAPKEMELLALITDPTVYLEVKARSDAFFEEELKDLEPLGPDPIIDERGGWVRIGTWTYDTEALQTVQSFPLQIDLSKFQGVSYSKNFIVRARTNWGGDRVPYTCLYRVRALGEIVRGKAE